MTCVSTRAHSAPPELCHFQLGLTRPQAAFQRGALVSVICRRVELSGAVSWPWRHKEHLTWFSFRRVFIFNPLCYLALTTVSLRVLKIAY